LTVICTLRMKARGWIFLRVGGEEDIVAVWVGDGGGGWWLVVRV
jgi:hypothetical protein